MSENQNNFSVSQEYELMSHQKGKAYPISINEWDFIKTKLKSINISQKQIQNELSFQLTKGDERYVQAP